MIERRHLFVALLFLPAGAAAQDAEPTSVAALELKATGLEVEVAKNLSELLTAEAGKVPGYKVISQSEVQDMVGFEIQKQTLGCDDEKCMSELGGALGVELIITGNVGKVGDTFVVNVKLIDVAAAETKHRVSETVPGRIELLPPIARIVAWKLFQQSVPADVTASYDATKARLDAEAAKAAGDSAALAAAEQARAEAEKIRAEAEKTRAEAEKAAAQKKQAPAPRVATTAPPAKTKPVDPGAGSWQRTARSISTIVAGLGLVGGGGLHAYSYLKAKEVEDDAQGSSEMGDPYTVYSGDMDTADTAAKLRKYAMVGYAAGLVGVVAATVFKILEPTEVEATAVRLVPTSNGIAVVF